jgi:hypothetical protein
LQCPWGFQRAAGGREAPHELHGSIYEENQSARVPVRFRPAVNFHISGYNQVVVFHLSLWWLDFCSLYSTYLSLPSIPKWTSSVLQQLRSVCSAQHVGLVSFLRVVRVAVRSSCRCTFLSTTAVASQSTGWCFADKSQQLDVSAAVSVVGQTGLVVGLQPQTVCLVSSEVVMKRRLCQQQQCKGAFILPYSAQQQWERIWLVGSLSSCSELVSSRVDHNLLLVLQPAMQYTMCVLVVAAYLTAYPACSCAMPLCLRFTVCRFRLATAWSGGVPRGLQCLHMQQAGLCCLCVAGTATSDCA